MRLLLVEDDAGTAEFMTIGLRQAGFAVHHASTGPQGLALLSSEPFDAAIMDLMLPGLDGLRVIERAREKGVATPVIIVSARRSVDERLRGLDAGGDDYLTKPFSFEELLARLRALARRAAPAAAAASLRLGNLTLEPLTREVRRSGRRLDLRAQEYKLLEYLLRNAGRVVSKTMILDHVWGYEFDPRTNVVDVLVCRLRDKLDLDGEPKLLQTVRGTGYVLRLPDITPM
jgi:two-component system, OmpR family, response regulator